MMIQSARRLLGAVALAATLSLPALAAGPAMDSATETKLKTLLAGPQRSDANKARDVYRHPLETLKFFGLKQDMAVMEIWPGGGWWTEILAPLVSEKGRYVAAHFDPDASQEYFKRAITGFKDKLGKDPANYSKVELAVLSPATGKTEPVAPGSMDLVLTFRNLHNWMGNGSDKVMIDAMYKSLKPGGYVGVKEHRASTAKEQDPKAASGYVREDFAIKMFENAGFKLVAKSEVNANAKDTKDYPAGVWTLPPSLREGEKDRTKFVAIGESDRMTLLFQKPAK
jgi:predicted methyltransferase